MTRGVRIVAGLAKRRRLVAPADGTRPTSDRAREALFNSLTGLLDLDGAAVLDLFAGTGAVGLEALSRGAARAVFVEYDRAALAVLRRNIDAVGLREAVVRSGNVETYVTAPPAEGPFDLVFADPPYALDDATLVRVLAALRPGEWLRPDAVLVVERSARGAPPAWPDTVEPLHDRRYGESALWYGRRR